MRVRVWSMVPLVVGLASCSGGGAAGPVTTPAATKAPAVATVTTTAGPPSVAACAAAPVDELGHLFGVTFSQPVVGHRAGWIESQCTWSADGKLSVSLALGSSASLAATGYAGSVAQYVGERQTSEATHVTVHPLRDIVDGGYYTESGAPKVVGYRGSTIVQLLTVGLDRPVTSDQLLAAARLVVAGASR